MSVVVSAQGEAPGVRPEPAMPSSQTPGVLEQGVVRAAAERAAAARPAVQGRSGRAVKLGDYFGRKPVVLAFVYYECPMLCTQVLNGLESALRVLNETVGKEFDVVAVSFDPRETPVLAAAKKKAYLDRYKRPEARAGLALPDRRASVDRRADQGGRLQLRLGRSDAAVRARSGIVVVTPEGKAVALFLRHRLLAARREVRADRIVGGQDRHRWPSSCCSTAITTIRRRGSTDSWRCSAVRIGGAVTLVALVGFMFVSIRRDTRATGH